MDMACINGRTEVGIKVSGRQIRWRGTACINRKMVQHMMAIGAKAACRGKAYTKLQTGAHMTAGMQTIRRKDMVYKLILTAQFIKDNGIKEESMEKK